MHILRTQISGEGGIFTLGYCLGDFVLRDFFQEDFVLSPHATADDIFHHDNLKSDSETLKSSIQTKVPNYVPHVQLLFTKCIQLA